VYERHRFTIEKMSISRCDWTARRLCLLNFYDRRSAIARFYSLCIRKVSSSARMHYYYYYGRSDVRDYDTSDRRNGSETDYPCIAASTRFTLVGDSQQPIREIIPRRYTAMRTRRGEQNRPLPLLGSFVSKLLLI
jgi:hypothetical protein